MTQFMRDYVKALKGSALGRWVAMHKRASELIAVIVFFGALAALFMGPILWNFNSAVHGFWGDGTGGIVWIESLDVPPFGGMTNMSNYPYGDDLFKPEFVTSAAYVLPFWAISKVFGPVAAWNVIVMLSFWLCGVGMYYLVKKLTRNRMAAVWAGVAFAYLPLHQYKAFGHIAYVMTFIFVFVLWRLLDFIERPTKRNAVLLGLLFAAQFYMDGYFVLFGMVLVGTPLVFLLFKYLLQLNKQNVDQFKQFLVGCLLFIGTATVALLPIVYVKLVYGAQIAASLAMSRGDFMANVKVYTARLYDYVLPIETHPLLGGPVREIRKVYNHSSNPSEYTLYLGVVLMALVAWTVYYYFRKRSLRDPKTTPQRRTLVILLVTAAVAFAISLQPYLKFMGHHIPMPSGVISVLVQYWRVYARLVLIIDLLLVVVAAFGLAIWLGRVKSRRNAVLIVAGLTLFTFFEYLSFNPFHRQDIWYYSRLSATDRWLAQQKDIDVIAVYPLVDQPNSLASLYTTEQQIHHKKMINSGTVTLKEARLRASISGLNDPQALGVLKALGAQAVMTHEIPDDRQVAGLTLKYSANEMPAGYGADVDLFYINKDITAPMYALVADTGFTDSMNPDLTSRHMINDLNGAVLEPRALPNFDGTLRPVAIEFDIVTTHHFISQDLVVTQGDKVLSSLTIEPNSRYHLSYEVAPGSGIKLIPVGGLSSDRPIYVERLVAR